MLADGLWMLFGAMFAAGMGTRSVSNYAEKEKWKAARITEEKAVLDPTLERQLIQRIQSPDSREKVYARIERYVADGGAFSRMYYFKEKFKWIGPNRLPLRCSNPPKTDVHSLDSSEQCVLSMLMNTYGKVSSCEFRFGQGTCKSKPRYKQLTEDFFRTEVCKHIYARDLIKNFARVYSNSDVYYLQSEADKLNRELSAKDPEWYMKGAKTIYTQYK